MNPLLQNYLKQINQDIDLLDEALEESRARFNTEKQAHHETSQRFWREHTELSMHKENAKAFAAIQTRNERLESVHDSLRQRLQQLLTYAKALGDGFHP